MSIKEKLLPRRLQDRINNFRAVKLDDARNAQLNSYIDENINRKPIPDEEIRDLDSLLYGANVRRDNCDFSKNDRLRSEWSNGIHAAGAICSMGAAIAGWEVAEVAQLPLVQQNVALAVAAAAVTVFGSMALVQGQVKSGSLLERFLQFKADMNIAKAEGNYWGAKLINEGIADLVCEVDSDMGNQDGSDDQSIL